MLFEGMGRTFEDVQEIKKHGRLIEIHLANISEKNFKIFWELTQTQER
jgi:hypothetical protein